MIVIQKETNLSENTSLYINIVSEIVKVYKIIMNIQIILNLKY